MSEALSALHASIDAGLGGVLLANMVEAWLAGNPDCLESVEAADEPQDHRTTPEQTRLHLCAPGDECPSAPPPGEHGAPVCTTHDGAGVGLERIGDSHARPGPGHDGDRDDKREDFKTLVADVSMGQVGAVFALEVSRLARSNLDWHRCWSCARSPRRW